MPSPPVYGINTDLGWKTESVWGTYVAVDKFSEYISETLNNERDSLVIPGLRNSRATFANQRRLGNSKVGGNIVVPMQVTGLETLLLHSMGVVNTTHPGTLAYLHSFSLGDTLPVGLSIQKRIGSVYYKFEGMKVREMDLEIAQNDYIKATFDFLGEDVNAAGSGAAATFATENFTFHAIDCAITIGGVASSMKSISLKLNNGIDEDRHFIGTYKVKDLNPGRRVVNGEFQLDFPDASTFYDAFVGGTEAAIVITATGPIIEAATPYQMVITIPHVLYNGELPKVGGEGVVSHTIPFQAYASGADKEFTLTLQNKLTAVA